MMNFSLCKLKPESETPILLHDKGECTICPARERSICAIFEPTQLTELEKHLQRVAFPAGKVFIEEGREADHFYVVTQGHVRLFNSMPDGRRQITGFGTASDFIGLVSCKNFAFSAEALTPLRACQFSVSEMSFLRRNFPALEKRLLEEASRELVRAQKRMLLLGRKTASERLASFLRERFLLSKSALGHLALPMTRMDIADYLGLTIETVSRTFSAFQRQGLIHIPHTRNVLIQDVEALSALADGDIALKHRHS